LSTTVSTSFPAPAAKHSHPAPLEQHLDRPVIDTATVSVAHRKELTRRDDSVQLPSSSQLQENAEASRREALHQEIRLSTELYVEGIAVRPEDLVPFRVGTKVNDQRQLMFDMNRRHQKEVLLPTELFLPRGSAVIFRWDPSSRFSLRPVEGKPVIFRDCEPITEVRLFERPAINDRVTSDGTAFNKLACFYHEGSVHFFFSNECALKGTGDDCKFCNINSTKDHFGEHTVFFKSARQLGEVYAEAFQAGWANHARLTGGFIPERREVDYYLDVAEEFRERTGQAELQALTVIGAPRDLSIIDKYREAGWSNLAINIEIWNEKIFDVICPGKSKQFGGWKNWLKALEHAAQVFGRGRVRSSIVSGLEPKESTLEGVEYLASIGVIAFPGPWIPNPGSALEGHRTPETSWHYDVIRKSAEIYRRHGFTTAQLYACSGWQNQFIDTFRVENGEAIDGKLPLWKFPDLTGRG
jgi:hypothetical protein